MNGRYLREPTGRSRREPDIADCGRGCRIWAVSAPTVGTSGRTGMRAKAVIYYRDREMGFTAQRRSQSFGSARIRGTLVRVRRGEHFASYATVLPNREKRPPRACSRVTKVLRLSSLFLFSGAGLGI